MPRLSPDHRYRAVRAMPERPEHPTEASLWDYLRAGGEDRPASMALEIYESAAHEAMQGWLMSKTSDEEISRRTGLAGAVVSAYRHLFFDASVFRHHFDLVCWIRDYGATPRATPEGHRFLRWAVLYGPEAVANLSGLPAHVDPLEVQRQAMIDAHFRSLEGRDSAIDSKTSKEALKYRQVAMAQAEILSRVAPPSAKDFAIKLRHRELTSAKIEVVDETDQEILH